VANSAVSVPNIGSAREAELPLKRAGFPTVADCESLSHGAFFLADFSLEGERARQPFVEPDFAHDDDAGLD
jgi:hypothetical protein